MCCIVCVAGATVPSESMSVFREVVKEFIQVICVVCSPCVFPYIY